MVSGKKKEKKDHRRDDALFAVLLLLFPHDASFHRFPLLFEVPPLQSWPHYVLSSTSGREKQVHE